MKNIYKIVFAFVLAFAGLNLSAQTGIHINYMHSVDVLKNESNVNLDGFTIGFDYNAKIAGDILSLQPGIYYYHLVNQDDAPENSGILSISYMQNYVSIPIHLKLGFDIVPKLNLYIYGGATFAFGIQDRVRSNYKEGGWMSVNSYSGKIKTRSETGSISKEKDSELKEHARFDTLVGGGIGILAFKHLDVKLGYDYGLIDRYRSKYKSSHSDEDLAAHREQFYVSLGVRF